MAIEIREIKSKKELRSFIKFPIALYKGNPYYVPPIIDFELSTLTDVNPAFDHCEAGYFLAYKEGKIVGRIAAIVHSQEVAEKNLMRFGWVDFIDDKNVSKALFDAVIQWGRTKGVKSIHGPMGFTDLDFEGMLVEGYEKLATQATIYNYPYYNDHMVALGFEKAVDWLEGTCKVPDEVPRRMKRISSIVSNRFGLQVKRVRRNKELLAYGEGVFRVLNESFQSLYGFYPLTDRQIQYYIKQYFGFVRKEFVTLVTDSKNVVVAFAISLPSLSSAFQRAGGSLYPFGFISVLRALRKNDLVDMLLIGVDPRFQKLGASQLIFTELLENYIRNNVKYATTAIMLEENRNVLNLWNEFEDNWELNGRRRCYIKPIES